MIILTDSAKAKLKEVLAEEANTALKLRVFVEGGGCSGFQYGFTFDEKQADDDFLLEFGDVQVLVDPISSQFLQGATVDFKQDLLGSSFSINNPNTTATCGCGSSFSMN